MEGFLEAFFKVGVVPGGGYGEAPEVKLSEEVFEFGFVFDVWVDEGPEV